MNVKPHQPFGVVVEADGAQALSDLDPQAIESLILAHSLVLLRGFAPSSDEQMTTFAQRFGDLLAWDFGYVLDLKIQADPQNHIFTKGRVELHWDGAFANAEPRYNFFQCLGSSADTGGGETTFLNTVKFLKSLPQDQLEQWQNLVVKYQAEKKAHYGGAIETPLFSRHPATGELRMQFIEPFNEDNAGVNPVQTSINGFEPEKSDAMLRELIECCYQSRYFYDHRWHKGDYLLVDNHANLHGRRKFKGQGLNRALKRIHIL